MSSAEARPTTPGSGGTPKAGPRGWAALAVLTLPVLLISVDMTVLGFAVPHLSEDLSPTAGQLLWIVDIYGFVLAGLLVTMGSLGDRIGRRRLLMIGSAGFGAASLLAAFAPTPEILIAARALLGLAGATLMPSTLSLLRNIFLDPRQRLLAIAIWASGFSAGAALGPIIGGWLLEHYWWGSVFLINLPVMAVTLVTVPLLVRESRNPTPGRLDLASVALSMGAMLPAVYGVKKLAEHGLSVTAVGAFAIGVALGVAFVRRQLKLADPLIDVRLFAVRKFSVGVATNFMLVFAMVSSLFFLTQYLQLVLGINPMNAGLLLLPGLVLSVVLSFVAVVLARRLSLRAIIVIALAFIAAGYLSLTQAPTQGGALLVVVAFALICTGAGLAETLTNDAILSAAPPARAGSAAAVSETAYELGGALGVALLGSVLTAVYQFRLGDVAGVPADAMGAARDTLGGAVISAESLPGDTGTALLDAARLAFTDGMHLTSVIATVLVIGAAIMAWTMLREPAKASAAPVGTAPAGAEAEQDEQKARC
ncbi:DHA2 family multidrug resistance protein-like MFS transporter [Nocardiopsis mwathae]|uniref:DHA2 family multidrug resistance protein-like MFS transporter n=1 Tax=Nocardiopsis mwathae TaxID=1472723 RepID=A0A7W9YIR7_9ACTN|nr:MFS transporter [Nocardiopsis mwathae]MBB6172710.1 DHA2 family multidrug resistance protein-like MFS transporter [Nocardiopsis mwathae]